MILSLGCLSAHPPVRPPTPATDLDVSGLEEPGPGQHYYVIVFSSQNTIKQPRYTHTWATVVQAADRGPGQTPVVKFQHTISWMPATLKIRIHSLQPEPGVNLELHETIQKVALANREKIFMWGPYECRPRFYVRFLVQKQFMESGRIGYQAVDNLGEARRKGDACDCIHAISDMDPIYDRREYRLTRYGEAAGRELVAKTLMEHDALINPGRMHDWLINALDLEKYPIIRRFETGAPRLIPILRPH
jgi:hypothetical protein